MKAASPRTASVVWPLIAFLVSAGFGGWAARQNATISFFSDGRPQDSAAKNARPKPGAEIKRAFPSEDEMLKAVMSAVVEDAPLLRAHKLHETVGKLNSAELSALFSKAVKLEDRDRRGPLLSALLARWMEIDPEGAKASVRPYRDRLRSMAGIDWRGVEYSVNQAWAEAAPEEALAEAIANPNSRWARDTARIAILSLSEGDPKRQLETLTQLPESSLRNELCVAAIKTLAEKDYAAAEAHLHLVTDRRQRSRVQAEILGALSERDSAAGLARLAALAPGLSEGIDSIRLVTEALRGASKKDPHAAIAAVDGLPEGLKTTALGSVLVGWADQNPIDALKWAADNGVDVDEAKGSFNFSDSGGMSWRTLLMVAFGRDLDKTLEWLRTMPPSAERDAMLRTGLWGGTKEQQLAIYSEMTPAGQANAAGDLVRTSLRYGKIGLEHIEPWVQAQPPGDARKAAIEQLVAFQANNSTERLEELAGTWSPGADRDAALRGIASTLIDGNPQRALEFARQINQPNARESIDEKIALEWFGRDKTAARAWISSTTELSAQQKRVLLRQVEERN